MCGSLIAICFVFFFNDTATTEIYTLSLHDALPIYLDRHGPGWAAPRDGVADDGGRPLPIDQYAASLGVGRSEEHTSELQSRQYLVCRLLLEKKNNNLYPQ